jgi:hypothetical protein
MNVHNSTQETSHEPLFSYGYLRAHYIGTTISAHECLAIKNFLRPEHRKATQTALTQDQSIFSTTPNTALQQQLSPISRQFLWELHSGIMLRLLENISGLANLLPDTHCQYSGFLSTTDTRPANTTIALILFININTGNATLYLPHLQPQPNIQDTTNNLKISYWRYIAERAATNSLGSNP